MKEITKPINWVINYVKELKEQLKAKKQASFEQIQKLENTLARKAEAAEHVDQETLLETKAAWKFWMIGLLTITLGYAVYQGQAVLGLIFAGFLLSVAIENLIGWFQQFNFSRGFGMFMGYFILVIFLLSGVLLIVPFVIQQMVDIFNIAIEQVRSLQIALQTQGIDVVLANSSLPSQIKSPLMSFIQEGDWVDSVQTALVDNISQLVSVGTGYIGNAGSLAVSIVSNVFSALFQISIVFMVAIFFSLEKEPVLHFLSRISGKAEETELKLIRLYSKLGFWLEGQLLLCVSVGVAVAIGLNILAWTGIDLPSKFTLSLIAGLTEFIPYLGPLLGMFPAVLLASVAFGWKGILGVLVVYTLIQWAENNFLVPYIMSKSLGVSPLVIFLCMLIGGSLFGFLGVILAVPLAVVINILFEDYKKTSKLGSRK